MTALNSSRRLPRWRQWPPIIGNRHDAIDAGVDPGGELSLLEVRGDILGDDAPRSDIGQHTFEAVAHFNAHPLVVLGDEKDGAVVLALLADLPRVGDADRVVFDRLRCGRRNDQHGELVGGARFPVS